MRSWLTGKTRRVQWRVAQLRSHSGHVTRSFGMGQAIHSHMAHRMLISRLNLLLVYQNEIKRFFSQKESGQWLRLSSREALCLNQNSPRLPRSDIGCFFIGLHWPLEEDCFLRKETLGFCDFLLFSPFQATSVILEVFYRPVSEP